jgi:hypothetical protein
MCEDVDAATLWREAGIRLVRPHLRSPLRGLGGRWYPSIDDELDRLRDEAMHDAQLADDEFCRGMEPEWDAATKEEQARLIGLSVETAKKR